MPRKQLIMEKALELFAEQGIEATSIQQITERAGISKGAFYLSFKSKDELLLALIDRFMMRLITALEQTVSRAGTEENPLERFYRTALEEFRRSLDFAKPFLLEHPKSLNRELLDKMREYNRLIDRIMLQLLEHAYGSRIRRIKYDLMHCMKAFLRSYAELFLFSSLPFDLETLSQSLAEKTDILARHMTTPFITEELAKWLQPQTGDAFAKERVIALIEETEEELEETLEKEALRLLKKDLLEPQLSPALLQGLLAILRHEPKCVWVAAVLENYFRSSSRNP